jgi:hypothetical protein
MSSSFLSIENHIACLPTQSGLFMRWLHHRFGFLGRKENLIQSCIGWIHDRLTYRNSGGVMNSRPFADKLVQERSRSEKNIECSKACNINKLGPVL